jgi:hypothetical protein
MNAQRREAQAPTILRSSEKRIYVHSLSLRLTDELYRQLRRLSPATRIARAKG